MDEREREQRVKVVAITGNEDEVKARLRALFGADDGQHYYDTQVAPRMVADRLRNQGENVGTVLTHPGYPGGHELVCSDCGKKSRAPQKPPANVVILCPACQRARRL